MVGIRERRGASGTVMKRELRAWLADRNLDAVAAAAATSTRVLGALIPLTYERDPLLAWRAIEAMGAAAERVAARDLGAVREHLRRLNWLITEESGGICWRAPEAMAEIVARLPEAYPEFIPIVVHLLVETAEEDLRHFRVGMLWAIGRLGPVGAAHVTDVVPAMTACLSHADSQVRGMAAWALSRVGRGDVVAALGQLVLDDGAVELYDGGRVVRTSVAVLARMAGDEAPAPRQPPRSANG
jgi:hypothetical protein